MGEEEGFFEALYLCLSVSLSLSLSLSTIEPHNLVLSCYLYHPVKSEKPLIIREAVTPGSNKK